MYNTTDIFDIPLGVGDTVFYPTYISNLYTPTIHRGTIVKFSQNTNYAFPIENVNVEDALSEKRFSFRAKNIIKEESIEFSKIKKDDIVMYSLQAYNNTEIFLLRIGVVDKIITGTYRYMVKNFFIENEYLAITSSNCIKINKDTALLFKLKN